MSGLALAWRQRYFWPHPEWWTIALSVAAWAMMLPHTWRHQHRITIGEEMGLWILMIVAMMFPFLLDTVRYIAESSLWRRRHRSIALFLLGYLIPWLVPGIAVSLLRQLEWGRHWLLVPTAFLVAAAWLSTLVCETADAACHRSYPLAPSGWLADRSALQFGWSIGTFCVISCWPLMIACAVSGHGLPAMAGGFAVTVQRRRYRRPRRRQAIQIALILAGLYLLW